MAHLLTKEEFEEIKTSFLEVDINGDGIISEDELLNAAMAKYEGQDLGGESIEDITKSVKQMMDFDENGTITFCEYLQMMAMFTHEKAHSELGLKLMFKSFDRDGNGFLTADELRRVWKLFIDPNADLPDEQLADMIKNVDEDGDGKISYDEFVKHMLSGGEGESESDSD